MSKRFWVETSPSGRQQFVLKRSRSHGHHHHHHHHGHDHVKVDKDHYTVTREEWNSLVERGRALEESNIALASDNRGLKTELDRLNCLVPQLQNQNAALYAENESLRRSVQNAGDHSARYSREVERLEIKVDKLEKEKRDIKDENSDLRVRVKSLSKQLDDSFNRRVTDLVREVDYWKDQYRMWRSKHDDLGRRHDVILLTLDTRTDKMKAYEDILKRHRII